MTNKRKAELFDRAMSWIYEHLVYADETEYEETLENIGFTYEEILTHYYQGTHLEDF